MEVLEQVGVVTPPTNVGQKAFSDLKTWLTVFTGTLAHDREMSHFIALAALHVRSWAVPPSRGMLAVAITTVPATHLEGPPLKVSLGISDKVWPVPSRYDTLNL